jgi:hypothetical protein
VKEYIKLKYSKQLIQWVAFFGSEKELYRILRDEMDKYAFNFPDNQCRYFFALLEEKYGEKKSRTQVRTEIQQIPKDPEQETESKES